MGFSRGALVFSMGFSRCALVFSMCFGKNVTSLKLYRSINLRNKAGKIPYSRLKGLSIVDNPVLMHACVLWNVLFQQQNFTNFSKTVLYTFVET